MGNFLAFYEKATPLQIAQGAAWYDEAAQAIRELARWHGCSIETAAGVVAALSQRQTWERNLQLAEDTLSGLRPATLQAVANKAEAIRDGAEPLDILKGDKIRAFYGALRGDEEAVVIDTWMRKAYGHPRESMTPKQYAVIAGALREDAAAVGMSPAKFQAAVWVTIRGSHK